MTSNEREVFLNMEIHNLNKCISNNRRELNSLILQKTQLEKELQLIAKQKRIILVEEYKQKLRDLLDETEYNIMMNGMDKKEYNAGKMIFIDIDTVYQDIKNIKDKFSESNIKLVNFIKTFSYDTYPPKNFYDVKFTIDGFTDIFVGNFIVSKVSSNIKECQENLKMDENFSFLTPEEIKSVSFFFVDNMDKYQDALEKLRFVKSNFPNSRIQNIDSNINIYIV